MTASPWTKANLAAKRAAFPLRAPRMITHAWWPLHVFAAAVEGYHEACMAVLRPRGNP